ncbi:hypothetical protein DSO57_1012498 [Entomophthora muscae]|uniref:Uncharacterized protein n=1 Tax=Entomophthora muscae TaxID=34485 RepID=A0ACC2T6C4_9FUNG|nr:hypothetical protein DSO57_1012498 [Entomophthora muscae]
MLTMANTDASHGLAKPSKAAISNNKGKASKKEKAEAKELLATKVEAIPEVNHSNGNGVKGSPKKTQEVQKNGTSASQTPPKRKAVNGSNPISKVSDKPIKKQKTTLIDNSDLSDLDYVTHNLQLILDAQAANDNSLLVPCLLKTTKFVRDKLIPKLSSEAAECLLLSIFDILPSQAQCFKVLKQWIQGLLDIHGLAISKNASIKEKFKIFSESSESRIEIYNSLSKLSSRVELILNQRRLMSSSRNTESATDELQAEESAEESSVEDISSDEEHVAFASSNPNWQDSDFLGEPDDYSSEYESDEPVQANGAPRGDSSDSD